jgi:hypothetical protein
MSYNQFYFTIGEANGEAGARDADADGLGHRAKIIE